MKFEEFKKLIKPYVAAFRNYAGVYEVRAGHAVFTNGYFILRTSISGNIQDGIYSVKDNLPSQVKLPNMAPFFEKDFSGAEDWSEVLSIGELVKPASKRKMAIVLKDCRIVSDGEGINLSTLNLIYSTGCTQIFIKDGMIRARNRYTDMTIFSMLTYSAKKGQAA